MCDDVDKIVVEDEGFEINNVHIGLHVSVLACCALLSGAPTLHKACRENLIHLLHPRLLAAEVLLERRQVAVVLVQVQRVVDGQAQLDHAVDAPAERVRLVQAEARGEQRGLEEQQHKVLDRLVALVRLGALAQLAHDDVVGVDLERLLGRHVRAHGVVAQRLRLWSVSEEQ